MSDNKEQSALIAKINEFKNGLRLVSNAASLIAESEFKGAYAKPVAEVQLWLESMKYDLEKQIKGLESALPKPTVSEKAVDSPKVITPEIVS